MFGEGFRMASSVASLAAEAVVDSARVVCGDHMVDVPPRTVRSVLLTFEDSIQGRIPEILGDDEDERIDTVVSLLRGSSEEDLSELIGVLQLALTRLADERTGSPARRSSSRQRAGRRR